MVETQSLYLPLQDDFTSPHCCRNHSTFGLLRYRIDSSRQPYAVYLGLAASDPASNKVTWSCATRYVWGIVQLLWERYCDRESPGPHSSPTSKTIHYQKQVTERRPHVRLNSPIMKCANNIVVVLFSEVAIPTRRIRRVIWKTGSRGSSLEQHPRYLRKLNPSRSWD